MKKDPKIFIDDIIESIEKIEKYTKGKTEDEFLDNDEIKDAVMRRLEIIGEAVKNIPDSFKNKHLEIPWKQIAGMRDILIHEYFGVIMERVWDTAKKDIPELKKQILKLLKDNK